MSKFTDEQHEELIRLCQKAQDRLEQSTADLNKAKETIELLTGVLKKSNEDIHLLLSFIKSKGLQPPKIQSDAIN
jgi:hemerythrin